MGKGNSISSSQQIKGKDKHYHYCSMKADKTTTKGKASIKEYSFSILLQFIPGYFLLKDVTPRYSLTCSCSM